tara:strand:- start:563 stop:853 length:291 start_codon:yes stop_codon:yes gene_type:complete
MKKNFFDRFKKAKSGKEMGNGKSKSGVDEDQNGSNQKSEKGNDSRSSSTKKLEKEQKNTGTFPTSWLFINYLFRQNLVIRKIFLQLFSLSSTDRSI